MKKFDYQLLNDLLLDTKVVSKLTTIYQLRGETSSYQIDYHEELKKLVAVAKIQSTDSSNRIEGIFTSDSRLNKIMSNKVEPHNRDEQEIAGYRDVLGLIHENYRYMPISRNTILSMHNMLFKYSGDSWGGKFKDINNKIVAKYSDGHEEVRFNPPDAFLVPELIENLCSSYNDAVKEETFSPLILSAAFVFDFVSIHPFRDGNGRMSRLLMLLTMYQLGFEVGKYISLEKIIEDSKESYYEALAASSVDWNENKNNYLPFIDYYLGIVVKAYRELIERMGLVHNPQKQLSAEKLILKILQQNLKPMSRAELVEQIPRYSQTTIQRNLKKLKDENKIQMIGKGRNVKYILRHS
ncbi:Fic family protein [Lactobacillus hamsteri]|uniref:Filamentation induced by cAMP protein Fic n=1 Tax=Lactobacillus hamsteri DSM 5661 = JCM 6256 TaxID=1423754 RepID=A0A0R1YFQ8_9LACO|nr:Fic family protein [Lactobacillus hamsteri]KRM37772.1 filamentation induced by cAMP protein Fic [Lactobacillus hamsteri DSM 5661 = JCM 6256]